MRMLRGSRANDTPRPTQLCPQCRPLRTQQPIVGVFHRGGLHCGRHTNQSHARIATARGELHAKLGELSNDVDPHQHHTPHRRGGRRRTRAGLEIDHSEPSGSRGRRRDHRQPNFARNLSWSFFETHQKRCNSNDANSTSEQVAGELRAKSMRRAAGPGRALKHRA